MCLKCNLVFYSVNSAQQGCLFILSFDHITLILSCYEISLVPFIIPVQRFSTLPEFFKNSYDLISDFNCNICLELSKMKFQFCGRYDMAFNEPIYRYKPNNIYLLFQRLREEFTHSNSHFLQPFTHNGWLVISDELNSFTVPCTDLIACR